MKIIAVYKDEVHKILEYIKNTPEWGSGDYSWTFNYLWSGGKHPYGFALTDDVGKIVGFLGTIYVDRELDSQIITYCNLATWIVNKEYRAFASILLKKVLSHDVVVTNFTPNENVVKILERMKFKSLNAVHSIASMITPLALVKSINLRFSVVSINESNLHFLSEADRQIYRDHRDKPCKCLLVIDSKQSFKPMLLVLFKSVAKRFGVANVAYVTDSELLSRIWHYIALKVAYLTKCLFSGEFVINSTIFKTKFKMSKPQNMLVYNQDGKIDFIYSELILTNKHIWN